MLAAEGFEVLSKEGLDAQGNSGHAKFLVKGRSAVGEGGRIGFKSDLFDLGEIEVCAEAFEKFSEVGRREHGWGAAAEVDCFEGSEVLLGKELCFRNEGLDEGAEIGFPGGMLVEGAIGTDPVAKRNVKIEMHPMNSAP